VEAAERAAMAAVEKVEPAEARVETLAVAKEEKAAAKEAAERAAVALMVAVDARAANAAAATDAEVVVKEDSAAKVVPRAKEVPVKVAARKLYLVRKE